jgi:hypothetical protein
MAPRKQQSISTIDCVLRDCVDGHAIVGEIPFPAMDLGRMHDVATNHLAVPSQIILTMHAGFVKL